MSTERHPAWSSACGCDLRRRGREAAYLFAALLLVGSVRTGLASSTLDDAVGCRKTISKKGRTYADKRRRLILGCVDKLLKCDLQDEIDGINPNTCRSRATSSCQRSLGSGGGLSTVAAAFHDKAAAACLPFGVTAMCSTAAGGLWYGNDPTCGSTNNNTCGATPDLPTLIDCLRGELDGRVDSDVGRIKPRAGLLLDNIGLGSGFPDIPRPPIVSVVVSATAPASGVLVNPGTVTITSGDAVQFSGDSTTLPCGGMGMGQGQNGKLTISVGTGTACNDPNAQQYVLREPYGPTDVAIFGAFTSDQNYCVQLKDTSCTDQVTGTIHVQ